MPELTVKALSFDQRAVLEALSFAIRGMGHAYPPVYLIASYTDRFRTRLASGGYAHPFGDEKTRRLLRELDELGFVVEAKRAHWSIHRDGRVALDRWREAQRARDAVSD